MLTGTIHIYPHSKHPRRIYIRPCYFGNNWKEGIYSIRSTLRSYSLKGGYGILISTISGKCKKVTARTIREI